MYPVLSRVVCKKQVLETKPNVWKEEKKSNFLKMYSFNSKNLGNYLWQKECGLKTVKSHFEGACKLFK